MQQDETKKIKLEELEKDKKNLEEFNKEGEGEIGLNDQEREACKDDYFKNKLPKYLRAKLRLLQAIKDTKEEIKNAKDDNTVKRLNNKKQLLTAARIYTYTLFENTWFGYLIAYANTSEITFELNGKKCEPKSYNNHLPSFSSAILHFGTCRDFLFPLLKIIFYLKNNNNFKDFSKEFLRFKYSIKGCDHNAELKSFLLERFNIKDFTIKDIEKLDKLCSRYEFSFKEDFEDIIEQEKWESYKKQAENIFENLSRFRNTFAHKMRILWWKNINYSNKLFIQRDFYDAIKNNNKADLVKDYYNKILDDHKKYEDDIYNKTNIDELISPTEILKEIHDANAKFLNNIFALIEQKPFYTESKQPDSTV